MADAFSLLDGHQYMNLTTYRKYGSEVTRPVWFAADGDTLYFITVEQSGKVTHIRNDERVFVSPSDARGNPLSDERAAGAATIYPEGDPTAKKANRALNAKYGLLKRLFGLRFLLSGATVVWGAIDPRTVDADEAA